MSQRLMRLAVLAHITRLGEEEGHGVGHTLIQKVIYLLQSALGIDLGYRYKIHYFGPYCQDVWADLTYLEDVGAVTIEANPSGFGYSIAPGSRIDEVMRFADEDVCRVVGRLVRLLGHRPVRELECLATTHFVYSELAQEHNNVPQAEVIARVTALKPHLTEGEISNALADLRDNGLL